MNTDIPDVSEKEVDKFLNENRISKIVFMGVHYDENGLERIPVVKEDVAVLMHPRSHVIIIEEKESKMTIILWEDIIVIEIPIQEGRKHLKMAYLQQQMSDRNFMMMARSGEEDGGFS